MTLPIDTSEYERVRAPVLDEFVYSRDGITINVDKPFLAKVCDNHNAAADCTGSLSQIVVGHTIDNAPEHDQPQTVGVLHNWAVEPWVNDKNETVSAAFADHYIKKHIDLTLNGAIIRLSAKALLERFPRRSGEVWWGSKTVDPHCLLGATAPERNLGLLRLSKNGTSDFAVPYHSPGKLSKMSDTNGAIQSAADLPIVKTLEETVMQLSNIMEGAQQLLASLQQLQQPQGQELQGGGQDDIESLLQSLGVQGGGQPQTPPDASQSAPAKLWKEEDDMATNAENFKLKAELAEALAQLSVGKLSKKVSKLKDEEGVLVDPNDDTLLKDLACMPEDVQDRMLARFAKGAERIPGQIGASLQRALNAGAPKKIGSAEETQAVAKLAREKGIDFAVAAKEAGYTL